MVWLDPWVRTVYVRNLGIVTHAGVKFSHDVSLAYFFAVWKA